MPTIPTALVKELAYKISDSEGKPRFTFFLGAGASQQSGIITASEMIDAFKKRIFAIGCPDLTTEDQKNGWLSKQEWHKTKESEYSKCFEQFEASRTGRQRYIERIIDEKEPSFGYVVLANLIASKYVNTIVTTNFDDLIYIACTSYTGIRPIVHAYGILASEMRISAQRPKVLKLHGDYLHQALKITEAETGSEDLNLVRQVSQIVNEYGLIVVGYSGADKSIMDILSEISVDNDLYWCVRRGSEPNDDVKKLLEDKRGFIVEIESFDQMMNEIRETVGLGVGKMFGSMEERQDHVIEKIKDFGDQYAVGVLNEIVQELREQNELRILRARERILDFECLELIIQARKARYEKDIKKAEDLFRQVIAKNPKYERAHNDLGNLLMDQKRLDEAKAEYLAEIDIDQEGIHAYGNLVVLLSKQNRKAEALEIAERALKKAPSLQIYVKLIALHRGFRNISESEKYEAEARKLLSPEAWYDIAGVECVSGNTDAAIENLRRWAQKPGVDREWAKQDPDFESIRDDPRFKEIVGDEDAQLSGAENSNA